MLPCVLQNWWLTTSWWSTRPPLARGPLLFTTTLRKRLTQKSLSTNLRNYWMQILYRDMSNTSDSHDLPLLLVPTLHIILSSLQLALVTGEQVATTITNHDYWNTPYQASVYHLTYNSSHSGTVRSQLPNIAWWRHKLTNKNKNLARSNISTKRRERGRSYRNTNH